MEKALRGLNRCCAFAFVRLLAGGLDEKLGHDCGSPVRRWNLRDSSAFAVAYALYDSRVAAP